MRKLLLLAALTTFLVGCDPKPKEPDVGSIVVVPDIPIVKEENVTQIKFGLYASGQPIVLIREFTPILEKLEEYMSARLGTPIKMSLVITKTYEEGVDMVVEGLVDFSRVGPASYVSVTTEDPEIDVLAVEADKNGEKVFYGIIAVHKNSTLLHVDELKGFTFAFGNEESTIGRYLSQQHLTQNGVLAKDLASFEYLGRHDRVGRAVGDRQFVAGALNENTFNKLVAEGVPIRELARFDNATKPWISSSQFDAELEQMLKEGLLSITDEEILGKLGVSGFLEGDDKDYVSIRNSILNNSEFFEGYTNPE